MDYDRLEEENQSDVKLYHPKHKNVVPYIGKISIFILHHNSQKNLMETTENVLIEKKFIVKNDISDFKSYYDEKIDVFSEVMYMAVFVSKEFLCDWDLLRILADNYVKNGENKKIIPLFIQDELYDFIEREDIINGLQEKIDVINKKYFDDNFNGNVAEEIRRMQKSLSVLKGFLNIALKRDKKSGKSLDLWQKIIKYISNDMDINLQDIVEDTRKKSKEEEKKEMKSQTEINNYIYGNGTQIQQGNENATQTQSIKQDFFDYEKVKKIIDEIRKNESQLEDIYDKEVATVQAILSEIAPLVEQKKEPQKIKKALSTLKELSLGVTGSLIASGIVAAISALNI